MSFSTITPAQRVEVRDSALQVASATQPHVQSGTTPTAAELALVTPALEAMSAALVVAGVSPTPPAGTATVANGDAVTVQNSAGTAYTTKPLAVVTGNTLTAVKLPATHVLTSNNATVPATGTGTTATLIVTNGVLTGVTLS